MQWQKVSSREIEVKGKILKIVSGTLSISLDNSENSKCPQNTILKCCHALPICSWFSSMSHVLTFNTWEWCFFANGPTAIRGMLDVGSIRDSRFHCLCPEKANILSVKCGSKNSPQFQCVYCKCILRDGFGPTCLARPTRWLLHLQLLGRSQPTVDSFCVFFCSYSTPQCARSKLCAARSLPRATVSSVPPPSPGCRPVLWR